MLKKISENVQEDSAECCIHSGYCTRRFREMFNTQFLGILKKIGRFIIQLNENRIKEYMLKHHQKYAQKLIKTSHMSIYKY